MTTTQNLQTVDSDVEQIQRLVSDYAWAIDNKNLDDLVALFTADSVFDMRPFGAPAAAEGEQAVRDNFAAMIDGLDGCVHMMMNHRIDVDGGIAHGTAYCHAFMIPAGGDTRVENLVSYTDNYVRTESGWKFKSRVIGKLLDEGTESTN